MGLSAGGAGFTTGATAGGRSGAPPFADLPAGLPAAEPPPAPGGAGAAPGLDVAKLRRYEGRIQRLERRGSRVVAVLDNGSVVDVTAGGAAPGGAPQPAPAGEGPQHRGAEPPASPTPADAPPADGPVVRVPAPLRALVQDPDVVEVSAVDETTWRVVGALSPRDVTARTGLAAVEDLVLHLSATDDTYSSLLWGLDNRGGTVGGFPALPDADVDGPEANTRATGAGVVVAVVDSGIQPDHPDLPPLWRNTAETSCDNGVDDDRNGYVDDCAGWDFVHRDATTYDLADRNDHGTHIAGTIAAIPNNRQGVAGLAPGVRIMSLKVTANGSLYLSDAAQAIRYAVDHGARVVNASFGTSPGAPRAAAAPLESAVEYARSRGVLVVAAAGNDAVNTDSTPTWPASLPQDNVIAVGASTANEQAASFSNFGAASVDLFAPGHYIASTVSEGRYGALQGTSMAAPHVTAAAALLLSQRPRLTPAQVREVLLSAVDVSPAYAGRAVTGGRLNAERALRPGALSDPAVSGEGFHDFVANRPHTAVLTVSASPEVIPADARVTWQAALLAAVDGATYGVVDHPVLVGGEATTTDGNAQVLLGPVEGVDAGVLAGDGAQVSLGTTLPAGDYALVVDVVAVEDRQHAYGQSAALFFTVPEAGQPSAPGPGAPGPSASAPGAVGPGPAGPGPVGPGPVGPGPVGPGPAVPGPTGPAAAAPESPAAGGAAGGHTTPSSGSGQPAPGVPADPGTPPPAAPPLPQPAPVTQDGITISSVLPNTGPETGGTLVMILGANFPQSPVVSFGGVPAYVASRGQVSLTVVAPAGTAGAVVDVTVGNRG
ncbi:MAG TPA: S8 family serine peptidase, partial [Pilimelia sp.]|nr:S8 family serine peptidase [Pilimelia sp.]